MCGFAGIYLFRSTLAADELERRVTAMAHTIVHRGPDAASTMIEPFGAAAFRRLAIVDLVTGDQPVQNGDGSIRVMFNGEIYNHVALRERLRVEHGIEVAGGSDAAVLPHLYELYGDDFVELLNGMFAICVFDARSRRCTLYRDRLGIKPLYYATTKEGVVFASELKALFASGLIEAAIDPAQVVPFLELFYVPGNRTLCRGVHKLMPGERLELRPTLTPHTARWWRLEAERDLRDDDALDELDALLADSTRLQLMADVPIGISLSGGLDSSLIAHYAHAGNAAVRAYTISFPSTDPGELECARQVSRQLGIEQIEITAEEGDFLAELDATTWFNDEPVADPAFYPALLVARAAAQHVKVLLAGSGADELFAGYGHYRLSSRAVAYRLLAHAFGDGLARRATGMRRSPRDREAIRAFGRDRLPYHARAMTHLADLDREALRDVTQRDHLAEIAECFRQAAHLDPRNRQLCVDTRTYLPHQLLSLLDRTTMAASVEGRVPFLDHRVAEFAMTVHGRHKYASKHGNKILLRRLAARHLPADVSTRKKHGFPNSVPQWLAPARLPAVREQLLGAGNAGFCADFLPRHWLESVLASPESLADNALTVHTLLVLESWHRVFARGASRPHAEAAAARTAVT
ncbi:MAG: asparagine synthase (glutamine-hydrolyzing) [Planctomycetes bacterium]|nr:asparagine synthase (glutamine-hydrolyzing) [Planctomycetota bacterium]